jgi:hypothetical protein
MAKRLTPPMIPEIVTGVNVAKPQNYMKVDIPVSEHV